MMARDPETLGEWQEAADAAYFALALDSARQYGLVATKMRFDIDRCVVILKRAKRLGIEPSKDFAE